MGTALHVQPTVPDEAPRYAVRLIGSLPGGSLVVTAPAVDGKVRIIREGQRFNVRVLKGERVVGFVAQVLDVSLKPYPHLHLEYPTEFEEIVVRNASRVNTNLPVMVTNTTIDQPDGVPATVIDLSETGIRIASDVALGQSDDVLQLKLALQVGGQTDHLTLKGDVRSTVRRDNPADDDAIFTGVAFRSLTRYQQVLLNAWVTRRLLDEALHASGD